MIGDELGNTDIEPTPRRRWPLGGWGELDWIRKGLSIDTTFWSARERWPHDPPGYVFLARAADKLGNAMFGQFWTGKEWTTPVIAGVDPSFIARRAAVQQQIVMLLEAAKLIVALRPATGGEMIISPPELWNTEPQYLRNRFYRCQMDPDAPFSNTLISQNNCWIFIARDSLQVEIARHPFAPTPTATEAGLTPYLITMLSVHQQLKITPENQPSEEGSRSSNSRLLERAFQEYRSQSEPL